MAPKPKDGDAQPDPKKRRRVAFTQIDAGSEANDCMKVFLVRSQDEVGATSTFCLDCVDLNHFFGEDGKIYGYKNLKINVWLSAISFHAYAEITFERTFDGGKGITNLKPALQSIFGESLLEKDQFLQTFSTETHFISSSIADGVHCRSSESEEASDAHSDIYDPSTEVIRTSLNTMPAGLLYSRLVPLILLLVDGGTPVDITDSKWDIYFIVKKVQDQSGDCSVQLLGFATAYRFFHYPDSTRFRVSQILVLPPFQGQGYGRRLLDAIYSVAVSENVYDVTFEEPSEHLQYLRACTDTVRLLEFEPIKPAINSVVQYLKENNLSKKTGKSNYKSQFAPPQHVIGVVRQKLKINKKQFVRCWDLLIYLNLDPKNRRCMDNFEACVSDRLRGDILDKDAEANGKRLIEVPNDYDHDMTFVVMWSEAGGDSEGGLEGDQAAQEEQLNEVVKKEVEEIVEIAQKIYAHSK